MEGEAVARLGHAVSAGQPGHRFGAAGPVKCWEEEALSAQLFSGLGDFAFLSQHQGSDSPAQWSLPLPLSLPEGERRGRH